MICMNVLKPALSMWTSLIVFDSNKDESLRFCIGYTKLSTANVKDTHPIFRVVECLDPFGEVCLFSTLHVHSGHWKVEIDDREKEKATCLLH